jgi:hypothetical protein
MEPETKLSGRYRKYLRKASTYKGGVENYISQAEAARIRGVSNQAIADLISRGRLTAVSVAGRTVVLRSEVEAFVPRPKLGARPAVQERHQQEIAEKESAAGIGLCLSA